MIAITTISSIRVKAAEELGRRKSELRTRERRGAEEEREFKKLKGWVREVEIRKSEVEENGDSKTELLNG